MQGCYANITTTNAKKNRPDEFNDKFVYFALLVANESYPKNAAPWDEESHSDTRFFKSRAASGRGYFGTACS